MMTFVAMLVVVLGFGIPLGLAAAFLALSVIGLLGGRSGYHARRSFECPVRHEPVTADFAVPLGSAQPSSVLWCAAFRRPERVTCGQACRADVSVRWTPPVGMFAGWALTAGGTAGPTGEIAQVRG